MSDKNINEEVVEESTGKKPVFGKKAKVIVIDLAAVVLAAAIGIGLSFVFSKTVSGAWELVVNPEVAASTADEIPESEKVYYVFEKPDRYGKGRWHICYQGGVEYYEYELTEEDSVEKINLGSGNLEYRITGSRLFGNAKMTIVYPEYTDESTGVTYDAEEYVFEGAKSPDYDKGSYKAYDTDQKLLGKWANNQRSLSYFYYSLYYTQTVEIRDNGIMVIHYESKDLGLDRYMYYAYTAKDSELTFSLVTDKDTKYTVSYGFDENGNLKFTKDTTTASIFADAIFGDFTYYTAENLPEAPEASFDESFYSE